MNAVELLRRLEEEIFETPLCTAVLEFGDRTATVDVLGLTARSADLRCSEDIDETGPVALAIDGFRRFEGELVRRHGRIIGMAFRSPEDSDRSEAVAEPAQRAKSHDPKMSPRRRRAMRQHLRSAVFWSGVVQAGRESIDCIVLNMSAGGAKVKLLNRFANDGSPVVLHIDRMGGYAGEVVWSEGDLIGLRFLKDPKAIQADIDRALGRAGKSG